MLSCHNGTELWQKVNLEKPVVFFNPTLPISCGKDLHESWNACLVLVVKKKNFRVDTFFGE